MSIFGVRSPFPWASQPIPLRANAPRSSLTVPGLEPVNTARLRDYQSQGARWLRQHKRALLCDDPGLGKTAQCLRALPLQCKAIVICPAHLRHVWADECAVWRPDLTPVLGPLRTPQAGELVVCSIDSLPEPPPRARVLLPGLPLWDVYGLLDEAHYAKNATAQRTRRVRLLSRQIGTLWGATGTPMLGTRDDLWGVLTSVGVAQQAFGSREAFAAAFEAGTVRETLSSVMLRRRREDVLPELPEAIVSTIKLETPPDLRPLLDDTLSAWRKWSNPDELPPFKLLSAALSALAQSRTQAAIQHVRGALDEGPIVVFSTHRAPVLALAGLPRFAVVTGDTHPDERAALAKAFQEGHLQGIAGTIDAMGTGLTLTRASRMLFIDESFTPGENKQARDRCLRIGQRNCVLIEKMVSDHPLDLRRQEILARKEAEIAQAIG